MRSPRRRGGRPRARRAASARAELRRGRRPVGRVGSSDARVGCRHRGRRGARPRAPRRAVSRARCVDSAKLLGEGWDNSVWVVEERWAFRFPRRADRDRRRARASWRCCRRLAPLLPVPIPEPQLVGAPNERYPWPFFGAPLLLGDEPAEAELTDDDRVAIGEELGRFLRALHSPETLAAVDPQRVLPVDFNRRADMPYPGRGCPGASSEASDGSLAPAGARRAHPHRGRGASARRREDPKCSPTATCTSATFWSSGEPSRASSTGATSASQIPRSTSCSSGCSCRPPPESASLRRMAGSTTSGCCELVFLRSSSALRWRRTRGTSATRASNESASAALERTLID